MKTDNLKYFSLMMAMGSMAQSKEYYKSDYHKPSNLLEERRPSTIKGMSEEMKAIKNGLKCFHYPKGYVYALNKKNADKKAKKLNLI